MKCEKWVIYRRKQKKLWSILVRIFLACVFLGCGVGAVVYSVINANGNQKHSVAKTEYFNANITQQCLNGKITTEMRYKNPMNQTRIPMILKYGMEWQQDKEGQRIRHRVGLDKKLWKYTYYVSFDRTYVDTPTGCTRMDNFGYDDYLKRFGLGELRKTRSERVEIGHSSTGVFVYEGEPGPGAKYEDTHGVFAHPDLVFGFTSEETGATLGWMAYFPTSNTTTLYKEEYWFPTMELKKPDIDVFEPPVHCH
ncbi:hypothetical protein L596_002680 [Steinernema carpocapsae]|uniref:Uncharacterized protein n=1 Tax=Steinernema carpocapsae TaxID=34508 RepID=A0A4U8UQ81_STECR|nr:hypothetical protein L596_002680 [Steinernema carpocapsae]